MANCSSCGQRMVHYENPSREVCANSACPGPGQDSSTGTRKLPPGAYLHCYQPGSLRGENVRFGGRMKPATHAEPRLRNRHPLTSLRPEQIMARIAGGWRRCPDGSWRIPSDWPALEWPPPQ